MSLVKGSLYKKSDFGITFPKNLRYIAEINGEDYTFFTIGDEFDNEFVSDGVLIVGSPVQQNTVPKRKSHLFVRTLPEKKFEYIGEIYVTKPHDAKRNLVVVK